MSTFSEPLSGVLSRSRQLRISRHVNWFHFWQGVVLRVGAVVKLPVVTQHEFSLKFTYRLKVTRAKHVSESAWSENIVQHGSLFKRNIYYNLHWEWQTENCKSGLNWRACDNNKKNNCKIHCFLGPWSLHCFQFESDTVYESSMRMIRKRLFTSLAILGCFSLVLCLYLSSEKQRFQGEKFIKQSNPGSKAYICI